MPVPLTVPVSPVTHGSVGKSTRRKPKHRKQIETNEKIGAYVCWAALLFSQDSILIYIGPR